MEKKGVFKICTVFDNLRLDSHEQTIIFLYHLLIVFFNRIFRAVPFP